MRISLDISNPPGGWSPRPTGSSLSSYARRRLVPRWSAPKRHPGRGISLPIREKSPSLPGAATAALRRSAPLGKPLQDQPSHLAAVGPTLGLSHNGPNQRTDRLHVAGADLLGGLGVAGDRPVHDLLEPVAQRPE